MEAENLSPSKTSKNEKSGKKKDLSWQYFSFFPTLGIEVEFCSRCRCIWSYFIAAYIMFVKLLVLVF